MQGLSLRGSICAAYGSYTTPLEIRVQHPAPKNIRPLDPVDVNPDTKGPRHLKPHSTLPGHYRHGRRGVHHRGRPDDVRISLPLWTAPTVAEIAPSPV